jgi:hypothetical protein
MANYPYLRLFRAGKQKASQEMLEPHANDPGEQRSYPPTVHQLTKTLAQLTKTPHVMGFPQAAARAPSKAGRHPALAVVFVVLTSARCATSTAATSSTA